MIHFTPKWAEPKRELNKWQFVLQLFPDYAQFGYTRLYFAFFKLHLRPQDGESLTRGKHYRGFFINKSFKTSWQ